MSKRYHEVMQGTSDCARHLPLVGSTLRLSKSRGSRHEKRFQACDITEGDVTPITQRPAWGLRVFQALPQSTGLDRYLSQIGSS